MKSAFIAVLLLSCVGTPLIALIRPRWALPLFWLVLPILYTAGNSYRLLSYEYPLTYLSVVTWGIALARLGHLTGTGHWSHAELLGLICWAAMAVTALPSFLVTPGDSGLQLLLLNVLLTGIIEPFVLYLFLRSWLLRHRRLDWYIGSILSSLVAGVLISIVMRKTLGLDYSIYRDNIEDLRQNAFSFGNANLYGMNVVLAFPLALCLAGWNPRFRTAATCISVLFFGVTTFYTFSRGTILVLAFQSVLWILVFRKLELGIRYLLTFALLLVVLLVALPDATAFMGRRFAESDVVGLVLGVSDLTAIHESDWARKDIWANAARFISVNPLGGAGSMADAENLFLTTMMKFGWLPGLALFLLIAIPTWSAVIVVPKNEREAHLRCALICALAGFLLYGATTGSDLSHLTVREDGIIPQNAGVCFLAGVLALGSMLPGGKPSRGARPVLYGGGHL